MLTIVENRLFLSGQENEKPESTRKSGQPLLEGHLLLMPSLVDVRFRVRQLSCLQNDRTNKRMTENDHITSALLVEVIIIIIIIIIICHRPSERQDIFN